MSSTTDRIKGYANQAIGSLKKGVGKIVGSERMQVEGKVQEVKGKSQKLAGAAKRNLGR